MTPIQEKICTILGWRWYCFSYHRHGMRGGVWVHRCVSFEQHDPRKGARPSKFKNVRLATPRDFNHHDVNFWEPSDDSIPKFEDDLNAMHEAYLALSAKVRREFNLNLLSITLKADGSVLGPYNATAAQRAQAFILTHRQPKSKKRK